jgi:hypothetical protein
MNGASRDYPAGELRVSDADRDRAVTELSEHFQAGRLTSDELDERSGQALRARTGNDLAELFGDLPRPEAAAPPPAADGGAPVARVSRALLAAPAAIVAAMIAAGIVSGHNFHLTGALVPVFVVLVVVLRLGRGPRRGGRGGPW